jgi:hypothetical protein
MMGMWNGLHFVWFRGRLVLFLSWADKLKRKRTKKRLVLHFVTVFIVLEDGMLAIFRCNSESVGL